MKRITTLLPLFICMLFLSQSVLAQDLVDFKKMKSVTPNEISKKSTVKESAPKAVQKTVAPAKLPDSRKSTAGKATSKKAVVLTNNQQNEVRKIKNEPSKVKKEASKSKSVEEAPKATTDSKKTIAFTNIGQSTASPAQKSTIKEYTVPAIPTPLLHYGKESTKANSMGASNVKNSTNQTANAKTVNLNQSQAVSGKANEAATKKYVESIIGKRIITSSEYAAKSNAGKALIDSQPELYLVSDKAPNQILADLKK